MGKELEPSQASLLHCSQVGFQVLGIRKKLEPFRVKVVQEHLPTKSSQKLVQSLTLVWDGFQLQLAEELVWFVLEFGFQAARLFAILPLREMFVILMRVRIQVKEVQIGVEIFP